MRRPALLIGPDLWPDGGATRRLGLVVLTVLSLLTALALLAHVGASRAADDWASTLSREATALIRPRADESGATAAARAAEALAGVRGVREAVALERAEADARERRVAVDGPRPRPCCAPGWARRIWPPCPCRSWCV